MKIKEKLRERLLDIPPRSNAYREKFSLADYLEVDPKEIEPLLNELCEKGILEEKIQYICKRCHETTILDKKLLEELIEESEDNCFVCDECENFINPETDKTGYIFYDVLDEQLLKQW